ncbi:MAG: NAD(P)-binding domain-containing protein [Halomonas sp.]|jgi:pyrroline-5-carboxylate reductase|uniref:pyrroline-5-carboxylate reductase family protein n=1 Tax=Halomonadaceae TaxID=28256 RepID=UPI0004870752|nr:MULTISPECIES: pyrroline-5-carboxylate reductase dimerization domain-containing protein [Halomonas]MAO49529.1 hypothetical protein [Pusillimonas sp.]MCE7520721.1 NAD(P)-binding domain-containing protein [Halomonas titanicae]NQY76057.1 NAD(P)-binding domain-containing protein [Halomonas sp.]|tara:strand:- start:519 stop:1313 length:795 start_codon:yes stop_codon:yes gene_type:complete
MSQSEVVGIIGGHGWMGRALGLSLLERRIISADQLVVSSRSENNNAYQDWPDVRRVKSNSELVELADVIVLSIRPDDLVSLNINANGKLVISLLAMASSEKIVSQVGSSRVIRAMPNAAAEIQRAYFPWYASEQVTEEDKQLVQTLLESCGKARELPEESNLDYLTALSGAGPAYPALLAQSMLEHAKQMDIADDIAQEAVMQTLVGGSLLLEQLGADPKEMVERLIAYNGTTAKGLSSMIEQGFHEAVHHGLTNAYRAASGQQ